MGTGARQGASRPMVSAIGGLMFVFQHAALIGLSEHGFEGLYQFTWGIHTELDSDARAPPGGFVDEVDVQRVCKRHVVRMIVRYVCFAQFEPILSALSPALNFRLMSNHCAHGALLCWQSLFKTLESCRRRRTVFSSHPPPAPDDRRDGRNKRSHG